MISHIKALGADVWGQSAEVVALIDKAREAGVMVTASQYPYTASGTSVTAALIPRWAEAGGALLKNLDDSRLRPRLVNEMNQNLARRGGTESLLMTASRDQAIVGKTLATIARERNKSPVDVAIEIIKAGGSSVASFNMKDSALGHDLLRRLRRTPAQVRYLSPKAASVRLRQTHRPARVRNPLQHLPSR